MLTASGDALNTKFWSEVKADAACITTNGIIKANGDAVMGAGNAKQASLAWPFLPGILGSKLKAMGNHVHYLSTDHTNFHATHILSFPTKQHWKDPSIPELIIQSAQELRAMAEESKWSRVLLPPPGCGMGGLRWAEVSSFLSPILDDRFTVVFLKR